MQQKSQGTQGGIRTNFIGVWQVPAQQFFWHKAIMPFIRIMVWLALAALAAASLLSALRTALAERVPHCAAEHSRELLISLVAVEPDAAGEAEGQPRRLRLLADVLEQAAPSCPLQGRRLRLNWYFAPQLQAGETWRVVANIRAPWGYQNPGGFDYERWLMGRGIHGVGYIRSGEREGAAPADLRRRLRALVADRVAPYARGAYLRALATGDSQGLTDADWSLLRRTGTVHLLVVSGLHVGLVATLGYMLGLAGVRLAPWLLLWAPAGLLAAGCSVLGILFFVWLCGAEAPALRAGVMGVLGALALAGGRRAPAASWLALAALAILAFSPLAVLSQGFWLSFGAVAALLAGFAHLRPRSGWFAGLLRAQLLMLFAMTPLTAVVVGEIAPVAGLSNLFAVPWLSLVVVPLVMLSLAASLLGAPVDWLGWALADWSLAALLAGLEALDGGSPHLAPTALWQGVLALAAFGYALAAPSWRVRLACLPLWAAGLLVLHDRPGWGEFEVRALDVGQGSALLVDTRRHRLLFDAGMKFPSGFDVGEAVVLPALAATGPVRLHRLIVSHGDMDHAGGVPAVLAGAPTASVLADLPGVPGKPCARGQRWVWDGVAFDILHPPPGRAAVGNDASCVLQVAAGDQRALFTGDISRRAEALLVDQGLAAARLLIAPHHGSRTSSSRRFLEAVNPSLVFVSAGWRNRYGHPHEAVMRRYRLLGAQVWITGVDGALFWSSARPQAVRALRRERLDGWKWWVNAPPAGAPH